MIVIRCRMKQTWTENVVFTYQQAEVPALIIDTTTGVLLAYLSLCLLDLLAKSSDGFLHVSPAFAKVH